MVKHSNVYEIKEATIDPYKPDFKRDSRGRLIMQLPGYEKWMISNRPGSKIISSGAEDYAGGPANDPGSLRTGSLSAETVIWVGDTIKLDGINRYISIGEKPQESGPSVIMSDEGVIGYSGSQPVFAFYVTNDSDDEFTNMDGDTEQVGRGDFMVGNLDSEEFILWNDSEGKLYIKGDIIIQGDIQSLNWPPNGYKLEYDTGIGYFTDIVLTGGTMDGVRIDGLASNSAPGIQGWTHDMVFTATDEDTIAWTSGTLELVNGDSWSINAGSLDMTTDDVYYIYFNGTTTLQTTTNAQTAVGLDKILVAVAKRVTELGHGKKARFQVFGGEGQNVFVTADNIAADSIAANEIVANSITGTEILSLYLGTKVLEATRGSVAGWEMGDYCLTKDKDLGTEQTRIQLCIGAGSDAGHIQAAYLHDETYGWTHPSAPIDLIQITQGEASDSHPEGGTRPLPRLDIYKAIGTASKKKVMLCDSGLYFFADNGTTITGRFYGGTSGNVNMDIDNFYVSDRSTSAEYVRIWERGIKISHNAVDAGRGINLTDETGSTYLRMYVDIGSRDYAGTIDMPNSDILTLRDNGGPPGNKMVSFVGRHAYGNYGVADFYQPIGLLTRDGSGSQPVPTVASNGWMFYHSGYNEVWAFVGGSWQALQTGASSLPSASSTFQMLYSTAAGPNWAHTEKVYVGGREQYFIERESGSPNSMILNVPSNIDFAFKRGTQWAAVIDDNIWSQGNLTCAGRLKFGYGLSGEIYYSLAKVYINRATVVNGTFQSLGDMYVSGTLRATGALECSNARIRIGGTDFYPFWSGTLGTTILAAGFPL